VDLLGINAPRLSLRDVRMKKIEVTKFCIEITTYHNAFYLYTNSDDTGYKFFFILLLESLILETMS